MFSDLLVELQVSLSRAPAPEARGVLEVILDESTDFKLDTEFPFEVSTAIASISFEHETEFTPIDDKVEPFPSWIVSLSSSSSFMAASRLNSPTVALPPARCRVRRLLRETQRTVRLKTCTVCSRLPATHEASARIDA